MAATLWAVGLLRCSATWRSIHGCSNGTSVRDADIGNAITTAGALSAATCQRCGYTELYVKNPASIPVDGKYVREVVGPEPTTPYR